MLGKLLKGGLVIVVRHAEVANGGGNCNDPTEPGPGLEKKGKDNMATVIGKVLKDRKVPIGEVSASPLKRTQQTANLAFPAMATAKTIKTDPKLCIDKHAGFKSYLTAKAANAKAGSNAVMVTHSTNLETLFTKKVDKDFKFSDGIVVKAADNKKSFVCVARINAADWANLK